MAAADTEPSPYDDYDPYGAQVDQLINAPDEPQPAYQPTALTGGQAEPIPPGTPYPQQAIPTAPPTVSPQALSRMPPAMRQAAEYFMGGQRPGARPQQLSDAELAASIQRARQGPQINLQSTTPQQPQDQQGGLWDTAKAVVGRGFLRSGEDGRQTVQLMNGQQPTPSPVPAASFEQPLEPQDFLSPSTFAQKALFALTRSWPQVVGGALGGAAGGAAGGAIGLSVGGPPGAATGAAGGAIAGEAAGVAAVSFLQALGPNTAAQLQLSPNDPDGAYNRAWQQSLVEAGTAGASMGLFRGNDISKLFGGPQIKGFFKNLMLQAAGQSTLGAGGQAAQNVVTGQPVGQGIPEAATGGVVMAGQAALTHAATRLLPGRPKTTSGVQTDEQAAAAANAAQQQPQQPYDLTTGQIVSPTGGNIPPPGGGYGGPITPPQPSLETVRQRVAQGSAGAPMGAVRPGPSQLEPDIYQAATTAEPNPPAAGGYGRGPLAGYTPPELPTQLLLPAPEARPGGVQETPEVIQAGATGVNQYEPPPLQEQLPQPQTWWGQGVARELVPALPAPEARGKASGTPEPTTPEVIQAGTTVNQYEPPPLQSEIAAREAAAREPTQEAPAGVTTGGEQVVPGEAAPPPPTPGTAAALPPELAAGMQKLGYPGDVQVTPAVATRLIADEVTAPEFNDYVARGGVKPEPAVTTQIGEKPAPEPVTTPSAKRAPAAEAPKIITPEMKAALKELGYTPTTIKGMSYDRAEEVVREGYPAPTVGEQARAARKAAIEGKAPTPGQVYTTPEEPTPTPSQPKPVPAMPTTLKGVEDRLTDLNTRTKELTEAEQQERTALQAEQLRMVNESIARQTGEEAPAQGAGLTAGMDRATREAFVERRLKYLNSRKKPTEAQVAERTRLTAEALEISKQNYIEERAAAAEAVRGSTPSQMAAEARAEVASQPRVIERPGRAPARVAPVETVTPELPKQLDRLGDALINKLLDRADPFYNKPELAAAAYGSKEPGTVGRDRVHNNFVDFLNDRIAQVEKPDLLQEAVDRATEAAKDRKLPKAQRDVITNDIEQAYKNQAKFAKQLEALKSLRDRLTGKPGDVEASPIRFFQVGDARAIERDLNQERIRAPGIEDPVHDLMDRMASDGRDYNYHQFLDRIINNPVAQMVAPHFTNLARRLKEILPADFKIGVANDTHMAAYRSSEDKIILNPENLRAARGRFSLAGTLLHEGVHAVMYGYEDHLYNTPESDLTPRELAHKQAIEALFNEVFRLAKNPMRGIGDEELHQLAYSLRSYEGIPREITTQLLTNERVQSVMAQENASRGLRDAMQRIGVYLGKGAKVWDAFRELVRNVFGLPARSGTALDYAMRALPDILQAAGERRRGITAADRMVFDRMQRFKPGDRIPDAVEARFGAAVNREAMTDNRSRIADGMDAMHQMFDRTAGGGMGLHMGYVRGRLPTLPDDSIIRYNQKEIPELREWRAANERAKERTKAERLKYVDERVDPDTNVRRPGVNDLRDRINGADPHLAELISNMSLRPIRLGTDNPRANAHVTLPEDLANLADRQRDFNNLSPQDQRTYRDQVQMYAEWNQNLKNARIEDALSRTTNLTPEERQAWAEKANTDRGLDELADGRSNPDVITREIAKTERAARWNGDWIPMRRHGDYVLSYGIKGTPLYGTEFFETFNEGQARRAELLQTGVKHPITGEDIPLGGENSPGHISQVRIKTEGKAFDKLPEGALAAIDRELASRNMPEAQRQQVREAMASHMLQAGTRSVLRQSEMRRKGVLGASTDYAKNLDNEFMAYTSAIGNLATRNDRIDAMTRAQNRVNEAGYDPKINPHTLNRMRLVMEEMQRRAESPDVDSSSSILGRRAKEMGTFNYLKDLARPAHLVVEVADTNSNALSLIGARHGFAAVGASLLNNSRILAGAAARYTSGNAMRAIGADLKLSNWDTVDYYRRQMIKSGMPELQANALADMMNRTGLIDHDRVREFQRMAGARSFLTGSTLGHSKYNLPGNLLSLYQVAEHATSSMTKAVVAMTAFQHEFARNGGNLGEAVNYAEQQTRDAAPNYQTKARLARGRLLGPLLQFRMYGLHQYGLLGNLAHEAWTRGGEEKREAVRALGMMLLSHALIQGPMRAVFGSLPVMAGLGLYDWLQGDKAPHTNEEIQTELRNFVRSVAGKTGAEVFANGGTTLLGFRLPSVKLANALDVQELQDFTAGSLGKVGVSAMLGPSGETAMDVIGAPRTLYQQAAAGDYSGISKFLPRMIGDPIQAYQWGQQGIKQGRETILPPGKLTTGDLVLKGLGFAPASVALARDAHMAQETVKNAEADEKSYLKAKLLGASPADRTGIGTLIRQYNLTHPRDPLTATEIQQAFKQQAMSNARPDNYGVRTSRREAPALAQVSRFAQ